MIDAQTVQAAADATKTGLNLALDGATIGLIVTNVFMLLKLRKPVSNGQRPGFTPKCIEHGEKIIKIETRQDNYDKDVAEIKESINAIREAVGNK